MRYVATLEVIVVVSPLALTSLCTSDSGSVKSGEQRMMSPRVDSVIGGSVVGVTYTSVSESVHGTLGMSTRGGALASASVPASTATTTSLVVPVSMAPLPASFVLKLPELPHPKTRAVQAASTRRCHPRPLA